MGADRFPKPLGGLRADTCPRLKTKGLPRRQFHQEKDQSGHPHQQRQRRQNSPYKEADHANPRVARILLRPAELSSLASGMGDGLRSLLWPRSNRARI